MSKFNCWDEQLQYLNSPTTFKRGGNVFLISFVAQNYFRSNLLFALYWNKTWKFWLLGHDIFITKNAEELSTNERANRIIQQFTTWSLFSFYFYKLIPHSPVVAEKIVPEFQSHHVREQIWYFLGF